MNLIPLRWIGFLCVFFFPLEEDARRTLQAVSFFLGEGGGGVVYNEGYAFRL